MSTKLQPGKFDCYAKLFDDEPYVVLRAKDPDAPLVVEEWANLRAVRNGLSNPKIEEARETAEAMREWRRRNIATKAFATSAQGDTIHASAQGDGDQRPALEHGLGAVEHDDAEAIQIPDTARPGRRW